MLEVRGGLVLSTTTMMVTQIGRSTRLSGKDWINQRCQCLGDQMVTTLASRVEVVGVIPIF